MAREQQLDADGKRTEELQPRLKSFSLLLVTCKWPKGQRSKGLGCCMRKKRGQRSEHKSVKVIHQVKYRSHLSVVSD